MSFLTYCHSLTRRARTNFYYAFVFLPKPRREAIFAAYAFSRHTDDLVDDRVEGVPEESLARWRAELEACYEGRPAHPITRRLAETLRQFPIPKQYFCDLIDGVEMDLTMRRYETFEDLYAYCYRVAAVIGLICIEIFGYTNPRARDYAVSLGIALQLTNILRDLGTDAEQDRIYLPRQDLERFGVTEDDLRARRYNDALRGLMAFECGRAREYYARAAALLPPEDRARLFSAEIMGRIYYGLLEKIERRRYDVFTRRIALSTPHKFAIALGLWARSRWTS
ncbi:MAG: squalene synthase HpnD [Candidatus Latescibacteria bacterium]|nr:squalene synthase HpnD [Candidatus Latescibacterota bacterium]